MTQMFMHPRLLSVMWWGETDSSDECITLYAVHSHECTQLLAFLGNK